jgi:crotonobetainyl-CoA:carnitine CoA-transferase CaiB-like acyl-CoA transferase
MFRIHYNKCAEPHRCRADRIYGWIRCRPGSPNDYVYLLTSRASPEHWPRLLKLIGREDLIGDARYDTSDARIRVGFVRIAVAVDADAM